MVAVEEAYDRLSRRIKETYRNNPDEYAKLKAAVNSFDFEKMRKFVKEKRAEVGQQTEKSTQMGLGAFFEYFEKILVLSERAEKAGKPRYADIKRGFFKKTIRIPVYTLTVEEEADLVALTSGLWKVLEKTFKEYGRYGVKEDFDGMLLCFQGVHKLRAYANSKSIDEEKYRSHMRHYCSTFGRHYQHFVAAIGKKYGLDGKFDLLIREEIPLVVDAEFKDIMYKYGGDSDAAAMAAIGVMSGVIGIAVVALLSGAITIPPILFVSLGVVGLAVALMKSGYKGPVGSPYITYLLLS